MLPIHILFPNKDNNSTLANGHKEEPGLTGVGRIAWSPLVLGRQATVWPHVRMTPMLREGLELGLNSFIKIQRGEKREEVSLEITKRIFQDRAGSDQDLTRSVCKSGKTAI